MEWLHARTVIKSVVNNQKSGIIFLESKRGKGAWIPFDRSHSLWWKPFFIDFVVFKDRLLAISGYLYMPCADSDNISEI